MSQTKVGELKYDSIQNTQLDIDPSLRFFEKMLTKIATIPKSSIIPEFITIIKHITHRKDRNAGMQVSFLFFAIFFVVMHLIAKLRISKHANITQKTKKDTKKCKQ